MTDTSERPFSLLMADQQIQPRARAESVNSWLAESRALHAKLLKRDELLEKLRNENQELRARAAVGESYRAEATNLQQKLSRLTESLPALRETASRATSYKAELQALQV